MGKPLRLPMLEGRGNIGPVQSLRQDVFGM